MRETTAIIVQARMGSTRLPGKVLKTVLGRPLLVYLVERLKRATRANELIVATTGKADDDAIVQYCEELGVHVYRGNEEDVLARYYNAAKQYRVDNIVRITADCPLMDPHVIDAALTLYEETACDYLSNTLDRTYPRGMDVEVFSFSCLHEAYSEASTQREREHVTPFIYDHADRYRIVQLKREKSSSQYRLTVDTPEDFKLIRVILENIYPLKPEFTLNDVLKELEKRPDWVFINASVEQKDH